MLKKFIDFFFEEDEIEYEPELKQEVEEKMVKEEPIFYETAHKPSTFINLEEQAPKPKQEEVKQVSRKERVSADKKPAVEYEFTSVISPIFGSNEEANAKKPKASPKASYASSTTKDSLLGTIISPIYGKVAMEEVEKKAASIQPKQEEELPPLVALEELIDVIPVPVTSSDVDLHQISLFDQQEINAGPSAEETLDSYGIKEYFEQRSN